MENTTLTTEIAATPNLDSSEKKTKAVDSPFLQSMKEHFTWYVSTAGLYGLVYTFCRYENPAGITYPAAIAAFILFAVLWIHKAGMAVKKSLFFYFVGMMLLGISTCMTANNGIHLFNAAGILLLFCTAMVHQMYEDSQWSFSVYITRLLVFAGTCLLSLFKPLEHMVYYVSKHKGGEGSSTAEKSSYSKESFACETRACVGRSATSTSYAAVRILPEGCYSTRITKQAPAVLTGAAIACLFLLCVMPLLIGSDQVFARYFRLSLTFAIPDFSTAIGLFFCFLTGFLMLYVSFAALFRQNLKRAEVTDCHGANALTGITFTAILACIYVIYSGIQILFLFLRRGLPDGMTYSQYAHEGFWQLLAVSLINIVTVLVCIQVFEKHPALKILLLVISLCTCVMTVSAAYRMLLYVGVYHLTFLRILVLWFLGVLTLLMSGVMVSIFREKFHLFQYFVAVITCGYIIFSFAQVDGIIASYNLRHAETVNRQDISYVLYGLSEDAAPYVKELAEMDIEKYILTNDDYYYDREQPYADDTKQGDPEEFETVGEYMEPEFTAYMERIVNRENTSLRKWNFAKARARKAAEEYLRK